MIKKSKLYFLNSFVKDNSLLALILFQNEMS